MSRKHLRGVEIPTANDDLLGGLSRMVDTAGVITRVASVAEARLVLSQATAAGITVSPDRKWYFDIGNVLYSADGTKNAGVFTLHAMSETERYSKNGATPTTNKTLAQGAEYVLQRVSIPAKPYRRGVRVHGVGYGSNVTGVVHLSARIGSENRVSSRFDGENNTSMSVSTMGEIPEGTAVEVVLAAYGGAPSGGRITILPDPTLTRLVVEAYPISMA